MKNSHNANGKRVKSRAANLRGPGSRPWRFAVGLLLSVLLCACEGHSAMLEELWGLNWDFNEGQIRQALDERYTETFVNEAHPGARIISGILKDAPTQVVSCRLDNGRFDSVTETLLISGTPDNAELARRGADELAENMAKSFGLKALAASQKYRYAFSGQGCLVRIGAYRAPAQMAAETGNDAWWVVAEVTRDSPPVSGADTAQKQGGTTAGNDGRKPRPNLDRNIEETISGIADFLKELKR